MGYLLNNRLEISVFINDKEYPLGDTNLLTALHIATSVRASVPVLTMEINDVQHVMDTIGLQDGIPIRVVIKPSGLATRIYNFRMFNHKRMQQGGSYTWRITGYLDAPLYWNATTSVGIQGTSDSVLKQIAAKCDLKYEGTATNDSQLWLPKNKAYRIFAKDVANSGYVDDTSCTQIGVDLDATLRYKDVNNLPAPTKKIVAYEYSQTAYTATEVAIAGNSGFNNALTGYQNMRYAQSAVGDELHTQINNLSFTPDSKAPLYNAGLKNKLGRGPVRFGPIDVGNVHNNYERASYQNMRYRNLFSLGLDLMLFQVTDFKLMEQFTFAVQNEDTGQDMANAGVYTITGHSIYVQGASYFEKLGVVRHGTNEKYVSA